MIVDLTGHRAKTSKVAKKPSKRLSQSKAAIAERVAARAEIAKTKAIKSAGTGVKRTDYKRGTTTKRNPAVRSALLTLWASFAYAVFAYVPVMMTLKYGGSTKKWMSVVPNDKTRLMHMRLLQEWFLEDFGYPMTFFWFLDFSTRGTSPHMHVLMCIPKSLPEGYATWAEWLELNWRVATQQEYDFDEYIAPTADVTWVPDSEDFEGCKTVAEAVKRFARYEGYKKNEDTGEKTKKVASKRVSPEWLKTGNYRVKFGGVSKALEQPKRKPKGVKVKLYCLCGIADFNSMMQEHSPAERDVREFASRDNAAETVHLDTGRWSLDFLHRGNTEFIEITPELIAAVRDIEEAHTECSAVAPAEEAISTPVAVEEAPIAPADTEEVFTPAEAQPVSSASATITKDSPMEDINKEFDAMLNSPDIAELEDERREAIRLTIAPRPVEEFIAERADILADSDLAPEQRASELERIDAIIAVTINETVTPEVVASTIAGAAELLHVAVLTGEMEQADKEKRITRIAKKVTARFEELIQHLAGVAADEVVGFSALPLANQPDVVLAPLVEIPRIAADPMIRRPRFVAGLVNRTHADIAFLAAYVRIERSMDAMIADQISIDEHVANYVAEKALADELVESGKMTPMPLDFDRVQEAASL
ncbi:hypothetical protein ACQCSV_13480 [Pseudarthrobacter sp. S3]|uniref:hypothetical protein n=1 Tax=Pseudarthrobacter sp. S3 TaxID=3418419 RepID=UPI003CE93624